MTDNLLTKTSHHHNYKIKNTNNLKPGLVTFLTWKHSRPYSYRTEAHTANTATTTTTFSLYLTGIAPETSHHYKESLLNCELL